MSHQTGITASEDLLRFFAESKDGSVRLIKIAIRDEKLELETEKGPIGTWDKDILYMNVDSVTFLRMSNEFLLFSLK
ncbi:hypothetical protein CHS0354_004939 [Potamilus streckersoni]|uniref:Uncharacterized protein n=1 Tax=Potamilus streckersoni TaxID=2493646 RepID=A0AAE0RNG1_9BIVA|nr:hypothetical protein CHS0354_004939 [Potamilus streckersoni]